MNSTFFFDFSVNKENNTINVRREFAAPLDLVWDAWTKPELLDLWWAPKPYKTETKSLEFREGGTWLYAMRSPEGTTNWSRADYQKIVDQNSFSTLHAFCDENGNINNHFSQSLWNNSFDEEGDATFVNVVIQFKQLEDLEKMVEMGFKEGFSMALENLDQYIQAQFKLRSQLRTNNKTRVCSYLNFPGNTEAAFLFYKSVFRSDFNGGIQRFGDIPPDANHPPVADAIKKMVLHVELPILGNHILMGTDAPKEMGFTLVQGNNMHISLEPETREEAKRIFEELSVGGNISMPLEDMFFGAYFGSFTDQFGINWMVNFNTGNLS
jgi:PhnB protein